MSFTSGVQKFFPFAPGVPNAIAGGVASITGIAPINVSPGQNPVVSLQTPLSVANGGTGTTNPVVTPGPNVTISGVWPFLTIGASVGSAGVASVIGSGNITSSGGSNPIISTVASPTFASETVTGGTSTNTLVVVASASVGTGLTAGTLGVSGGSTLTGLVSAGGNIIAASGDISTKTYYNINTYGASPAASAATNNMAISSAIAAAAGKGIVLIPGGVYNVSTDFIIPSNTTICLIGTLFMVAHTNTNLLYCTGLATSNIWIYGGGTIDVNGANQDNTSAAGIGFGFMNNVLIENISVINSFYFSISIFACTDVLLRNVTINTPAYTGWNAGQGATGLGFSGFGGTPCVNCWAVGCTILNTHDEAMSFYNGCNDCGFTDSYISGAVYGVGILTDTAGATNSTGIIIEGNTIVGCTQTPISTLISAPATGAHHNIIIRGNNIHDNSGGGLFLTSSNDLIVDGNMIYRNSAGVFLNVNSDVIISSNHIYDIGTAGGGTGISINGAPAGLAIVDNYFNNTGSLLMGNAITGTASATGFRQSGNTYSNIPGPPFGLGYVPGSDAAGHVGVCPVLVSFNGTAPPSNNLVQQSGFSLTGAGGTVAVTFPVAFGSGVLNEQVTPQAAANSVIICGSVTGTGSTTGITLYACNASGVGLAGVTLVWTMIGN
jgi:hypothetical protein